MSDFELRPSALVQEQPRRTTAPVPLRRRNTAVLPPAYHSRDPPDDPPATSHAESRPSWLCIRVTSPELIASVHVHAFYVILSP